MARTRTIRPEFWTDEKLAKASREARLLFVGLWTTSDDQGITHSNAALLKSQIFPYDDIKISVVKGWIDQLINLGMLIPYEAENGENYLFIKSFSKYQKIDHPAITQYNPLPREGLASLSNNLLGTQRKRARQTEYKQKLNLNRIKTETETMLFDGFETFWKTYPKKIGRGAAEKAWLKIKPKPNEELLKIMIKSIADFKESEQWQKDNGQFIPHPATWLNQKRWNDEVEISNKPKTLEELKEENREFIEKEIAEINGIY